VQGHVGLNRAVDGDVVAIEMLAEDGWSAPSDVVLQDEGADPGDVNPDEEAMLESAQNSKEKIPTGKIVAIIRRNWRQYCGIIQLGSYQGVRTVKMKEIYIYHLNHYRLSVTFLCQPRGRFLRSDLRLVKRTFWLIRGLLWPSTLGLDTPDIPRYCGAFVSKCYINFTLGRATL
jgi:exoribonuclease R